MTDMSCGPGYRQSKTIPGCEPCPDKKFSDNYSTTCQWCAHCKRTEVITRNCTKTSDTECRCPAGYVSHPHKPCHKCPQGTTVTNNQCRTIAPTSRAQPQASPADYTIPITIGIVLVLLVIVIILVVKAIQIRRRNRRRRSAPPDLLQHCLPHEEHNSKLLAETPPLPQKTKRYPPHPATGNPAGDNYYGPPPIVTPTPLRTTPLRLKDLKFSMVHDMEQLLSSHHSPNYKHLAGQLNYDAIFVRTLQEHENPVEHLLQDYVTRQTPTKEQFFEALLSIGRKDVADWFWADCQPIRQQQQDPVRQQLQEPIRHHPHLQQPHQQPHQQHPHHQNQHEHVNTI